MDQDIIDLQKRLAFQEHALEELQALVHEQADIIEALSKELNVVKRRVSDTTLIDPERTEEDDRPPHY